MANIRCPNCGKDNPDLLDVCQFCQTPLKPDSVLHIGEKPTKKSTGELENVLPDWLKNIQQQAKDAAEEQAVQAAASPKPLKDEPPDLLAGLATQTGSAEEDDIPDWLSSINPTAKPKSAEFSTPESTADFFAQFNQKESKPEPVSQAPAQEELPPSSMSGQREEATIPFERDELSEWFTQASEQPRETVGSDEGSGDIGWGGAFAPQSSSETSSPKEEEEEDLSWLHNLEAASKQPGGLEPPKPEMNWRADFETPSTPSPASQEDLSWLDRLGGIEEPAQPDSEPTVAPQPASQDDLSWLRRPAEFDEIPESPKSSQPEDLSW